MGVIKHSHIKTKISIAFLITIAIQTAQNLVYYQFKNQLLSQTFLSVIVFPLLYSFPANKFELHFRMCIKFLGKVAREQRL